MAGSNEADRVNSGKRGVVQRKECSTLVWLLQVPVVVQGCKLWHSCAWEGPRRRCPSGCTAPVTHSWPAVSGELRGGRCHAEKQGSALHLYMTESKKEDRSCGRAVSVFARQRSGWSRDLVEPRLLSTRVSSVEGQALKRRKEMLTLDLDVQPIDNQFVVFAHAEPGCDRHFELLAAKQDENCVQHARNQRIAARWQLRHLHGDGHLSDGPAARPQHDHPPTESAFQSAVC